MQTPIVGLFLQGHQQKGRSTHGNSHMAVGLNYCSQHRQMYKGAPVITQTIPVRTRDIAI